MSVAKRITMHFGGDWHGSYGLFPAPNHSADDRGMSVKDAENGDVLINSFNGADPLAVKAECRRLGLLPDRTLATGQWRITGIFTFNDEEGRPLYRTRRHEHSVEPKRFDVQRLEDGQWMAGLKDTRRVLYRLPQLLAAAPGDPVLLVEGERKADHLASLGFTATAVAFGCKGWRKEYAEPLKGRTVAILPDNDDVGRDFAKRAANDIAKGGGTAAVVELPGLPPSGDVLDWTGTAEELRALVEAAEVPASSALPVEMYGEISPQLEKRYLIKGLLMAGTNNIVFGQPGCGKSFLCIDWALHVAAGRDWFGRRVVRGGVVYVAAEGQGGVRMRVEAWKRTHGVETADFALIPASIDLLDPAADMAKLRCVLTDLAHKWGGIALLAVDTLAATFGGGDENGSDMAAYYGNVASLCEPYRCARIIVTHAPLIGEAKRPRGHGSQWGGADAVFHVSGDRDAPARRVHVLKQKDSDPGPDILFTLKQVGIGTDEDGERVTSCIVEESDVEPSQLSGGRRLSPKERVVLSALERTLIESGKFPPATIPDNVLNRARTGKVVALSEWRSAALSTLSNSDTKSDTPRRNFDRYRDKLQASEIIGVWEDWAWLV